MNGTNQTYEDYAVARTVAKFLHVIFCSLLVYTGFSLTLHEVVLNKKKNLKTSDNHKWLRLLNILASYFAFFRVFASTLLVSTVTFSGALCYFIYMFSIISLAVSGLLVYGFLLLRQSTLYNSRQTVNFRGKTFLMISCKTSYLMLFLIEIVHLVCFLLLAEVGSELFGYCTAKNAYLDIFVLLVKILGISMVLTQISLLVAFITPLIVHTKSSKSLSKNSNKKLVRVIKKSTIITIVCVASDTVMYATVGLVPQGTQFTLVRTNISILVNTMSIIFVFADWKRMIFPFGSLTLKTRSKNEKDRHKTGDSTSVIKTVSQNAATQNTHV